jgi:ParB family chromosome partitioning protein
LDNQTGFQMTATILTTELSRLSIDEKANVRKIGRGADTSFIASIRASGVRIPLIVRPRGENFVVIDGGKRLEALNALATEGAITSGHPVPIIVQDVTDAEARETSLTLNAIRSDMHPVDEYRAFAQMHTDKERPIDAQAIAVRFGLDLLYVQQHLALGTLDEKILDAWRDDMLDERAAEAFTLCPSKKAQVSIFDSLAKHGRIGAYSVRRALKLDQESVGQYLDFIGADAYAARGGKVTRDLFGTDHIVSDSKLVMVMVAELLDETCKSLVADGWAFAIQTPQEGYNYGQLEGTAKIPAALTAKKNSLLKKRDVINEAENADTDEEDKVEADLVDIEEQIEAVSYTAEQKAKAGCFVTIESGGFIEIAYGKIKPSEKRKVAGSEAKDKKSSETDAPKPSEAKVISNALAQRLSDQLIAATKNALKADKLAAGLPSILQKLVGGMIGGYGTPHDIVDALPAIRDAINSKLMNEAIRKSFDREDYFGNAPKPVLLAAITEAVSNDEARKLKDKTKAEIAKFALANIGKTAWLPGELRTANYDGPTKAKAKPQKRGQK